MGLDFEIELNFVEHPFLFLMHYATYEAFTLTVNPSAQ
jgi:hypothetical protein